MPLFTLRMLESAIDNWLSSTAAARKREKRKDGFWLISGNREVHFRLCADGSFEMELLERPARKVGPVSSVEQAVQLADLFLRQRCGFDALPGGDWKSLWRALWVVPAWVIDHPERITVDGIDNQPDRNVRDAMIELFGEDRYWNAKKLDPTGFIRDLNRDLANVIEQWRAKTGAEVDVARTTLCEGDPRNQEDILDVRSGSREVRFFEAFTWRDTPVDVVISEGDVRRRGHVSRREEAVRLLDHFLRLRCCLEELPGHWSENWLGS
jgi:hypothetical protein